MCTTEKRFKILIKIIFAEEFQEQEKIILILQVVVLRSL